MTPNVAAEHLTTTTPLATRWAMTQEPIMEGARILSLLKRMRPFEDVITLRQKQQQQRQDRQETGSGAAPRHLQQRQDREHRETCCGR